MNPARAAANPRTDEVEGQTPEIPFEVIEATIKSIDTGTVVGLRDRAVLAMLASTGCRVGALASFVLSRYYFNDGQWFVKLHEKNSKVRDVPVRHDLQRIIHAYLEEAGLTAGCGKDPLFRTAVGKTGRLRDYAAEELDDVGQVVSGEVGRMSQDDLRGMLKRRLVCTGYGTRETKVTAAGHKYTVYRSLYLNVAKLNVQVAIWRELVRNVPSSGPRYRGARQRWSGHRDRDHRVAHQTLSLPRGLLGFAGSNVLVGGEKCRRAEGSAA